MRHFIVFALILASTLIFDGPVLCARNSGGVHISCCCSRVAKTIDVPPCCGSRCRNFKFSQGGDAVLSSRNEVEAPDFDSGEYIPFYSSVPDIPASGFNLSRSTIETRPRPPDRHTFLSTIILIC